MFICAKSRRKNADKIEGMASWLILGGVLPLCVALVTDHQRSYSFASFITAERFPYLWVIAMGIASLQVKRGSGRWRLIVALGAVGFVAAAKMSADFVGILSIVWPFAVLLLLFTQYRCDMKAACAQTKMPRNT